MTILALIAAYIDPAESESLANRLNICVVLVLTLVTFSLDRPQALSDVPYSTFHDIYRRSFVLILVAVSVAVCLVPVSCKGQEDDPMCGCCKWCGASALDCITAAATF